MKNTLIAIAVAATFVALIARSQSGETRPPASKAEYAFVRWDGLDNSHIIKPNNEVMWAGVHLKKLRKPHGVDDRHFYQTAMMNLLSQEGWQFLSFFRDDVVMQRIK